VTAEKPPTIVELNWDHALVFNGRSGAIDLVLDSASAAGPSPMQALGFALAACMAMDVVHILKKGRSDLRGCRADLRGTRADQDPHRFTHIALHFTLTGVVPAEQVARAIQLSKDKYCSVWHSMRQDIAFTTSFAERP